MSEVEKKVPVNDIIAEENHRLKADNDHLAKEA
jgi:hypothetical protein